MKRARERGPVSRGPMGPGRFPERPIVVARWAHRLLVSGMLSPCIQTRARRSGRRARAIIGAAAWGIVLLAAAGVGRGPAALAQAARPEGLSASLSPAPSLPGSPTPPSAEPGCPLCEPAGVRLVRLSPADAAAQGGALAAWNERQLARIDSLYRAGRFGPAESEEAERGAHLMARLVTRNAYEALLQLATDSTTIYEANEATFAGPFATFSDPSLFPVTRLVQARFGLGRVCLRYELAGKLDTLVALGEKRVRVRLDDVSIEHERHRVLCMQLPIGVDQIVDVLVADHFSCRVRRTRTDGPPGPAVIDQLEDMKGFWVRKWGIHRPTALVFWVTPGADTLTALPSVPLVGVRLYVPNLVLSLPVLPDVGFDDLRELDLPQPILALETLRLGKHPAWLRPASSLQFEDWTCWGPVPAEVRRQFPDF